MGLYRFSGLGFAALPAVRPRLLGDLRLVGLPVFVLRLSGGRCRDFVPLKQKDSRWPGVFASLSTLLGHSLVGGVVYNAVLCTYMPR